MKHLGSWIIGLLSAVLLVESGFQLIPIKFEEACGFVSGAVCVWLAVRENPWNWPVGLVNNVFFAIIFARAKLYGDLGLQGVYLVLGVWGWWQWLKGGENHSARAISRARPVEWIALGVAVTAGTWGLQKLLLALNGAAPFWDAFTTMLSLAAQYLMSLKRLENWWVWILADLIYVPLYLHRDLPLTAALYAGFIVLCVIGWLRWSRDWRLVTAPRT